VGGAANQLQLIKAPSSHGNWNNKWSRKKPSRKIVACDTHRWNQTEVCFNYKTIRL